MSNKNIKFPIGAKEAAELLKVNHRTLKYWCREMGFTIVGNSYCLSEKDFSCLKDQADRYFLHEKYLKSIK